MVVYAVKVIHKAYLYGKEYTYRVNESTVYNEEGTAHTVYGVDVVDDQENIIESIPDVFFDRPKAEKLVKMCNKYNLALIHLREVVEDNIDG